MFLKPDQIRPYLYTNPDNERPLHALRVILSQPSDNELLYLAADYQKIMLEAWTPQFAGRYSEEDIAQTVGLKPDPDQRSLFNKHAHDQAARLREGNTADGSAYVHAEVEADCLSRGDSSHIRIGIGKGTVVDARSRFAQLVHGTSADNQLADISNIFVRPNLYCKRAILPVQARGVGSALMRSLLDGFNPDMQTAVYDYPENHRVAAWLTERLGFSPVKTWDVELFGTTVPQTYYQGPTVGDLIETLETRRPWLADREPLLAQAS